MLTARRVLLICKMADIKISIKDDGVGMPQEIINKIFEPYFTTKDMGNGLGLASSYAIINKHGGLLNVKSNVNEGSTFHIYLPASQKEIVKKGVESVSTSIIASGSGKILLMDDDKDILEMAYNMLGFIGYNVVCATNGVETLNLYMDAIHNNEPFNAVIMDLTIPCGMGGKECIKKLLEFDPEAKVIVCSGYSNNQILGDFKKYGFKGVLSKPFQIKEANELLQQLINS